MFENIKADWSRRTTFYTTTGERKSWQHSSHPIWNKIRISLEMGMLAAVLYRYGKWAQKIRSPLIRKPLLFIYFILNCCMMVFFGINLQLDGEIGKGLIVHNYSGIFIMAEKIGENFTCNQGVTIGRLRGRPRDAIIGNNVYFGAGAKCLGDVTIGDNVVVGANSLVLTSIPDNCTVIGVPARIVSRSVSSPYSKLIVAQQPENNE